MMEFSKAITVLQIILFMIYHVSTDNKSVQAFIVTISSEGISGCPDNEKLAEARYNITQLIHRQLSDVDECQNDTLNNCDKINGACINTVGSFSCSCTRGFGGDGIDTEQGGTGCYLLPQGCGAGNWRRVAYLNMTDSSQQCPSNWKEYSNPSRSCGPPSSLSDSCASEYFSNSETYSRVCGKVIGYQSGSPDGYYASGLNDNIDDPYVDGVSITRGPPLARQHIWTLSAHSAAAHCPCGGDSNGTPSFVGDHDYCGSEANQCIWDGVGCEISSCCNGPPWFVRNLGSTFSDGIEIRICLDQTPGNELVLIESIEVYIE